MSFQSNLATGKAGESMIATWLRSKGYSVLPVYEKIIDEGKGPALFLPSEQRVAPDLFCFKGENALWIEAKHKTAFSWYRKKGIWTTGIDIRHYNDYCIVDDNSPWPVWLLFLHKGGTAKDSPPSPSGLYGEMLSKLRLCVDHQSDRHAHGMVYWNRDSLKLIAQLKELEHCFTA